MKKFRHKITGTIATEEADGYYIFPVKENDGTHNSKYICRLEEWLFISSQDREEIVVEDWIDDCINEIEGKMEYKKTGVCLTSYPAQYPKFNRKDVRDIIEKHAPKQKKFTHKEIATIISFKDPMKSLYEFIIEIFADNGLLEE